MHTIGKILKTIREERGLQLRQVAIESNIDLTLLSRVENGKRMPSESLLIKLAETYGLTTYYCIPLYALPITEETVGTY